MCTRTPIRRKASAQAVPTAAISNMMPRLLVAAEVATVLRVTEKALEHWRRRGDGPAFIRLARNCIRYREGDVIEYLERRVAE